MVVRLKTQLKIPFKDYQLGPWLRRVVKEIPIERRKAFAEELRLMPLFKECKNKELLKATITRLLGKEANCE